MKIMKMTDSNETHINIDNFKNEVEWSNIHILLHKYLYSNRYLLQDEFT